VRNERLLLNVEPQPTIALVGWGWVSTRTKRPARRAARGMDGTGKHSIDSTWARREILRRARFTMARTRRFALPSAALFPCCISSLLVSPGEMESKGNRVVSRFADIYCRTDLPAYHRRSKYNQVFDHAVLLTISLCFKAASSTLGFREALLGLHMCNSSPRMTVRNGRDKQDSLSVEL
jgi:hypothetical protein